MSTLSSLENSVCTFFKRKIAIEASVFGGYLYVYTGRVHTTLYSCDSCCSAYKSVLKKTRTDYLFTIGHAEFLSNFKGRQFLKWMRLEAEYVRLIEAPTTSTANV